MTTLVAFDAKIFSCAYALAFAHSLLPGVRSPFRRTQRKASRRDFVVKALVKAHLPYQLQTL
jgi:hypothetical protein